MWSPRKSFDGITDRFVRWLDRVAEIGLFRMFWRNATAWFGHRLVTQKLVAGESVVAEVKHSFILYVLPVGVGLIGLILAVWWLPFVPQSVVWLPILLVLGMLGYCLYKALSVARDRFVVTDSRVFRVWGVFTLNEAEMEIARLVDITVLRPWYLRIILAGHLVLENAAQDQGLREIYYVPRPEEVARVVHALRREMVEEPPPVPTVEVNTRSKRADHPRTPGPVTARRRSYTR